jgi:hypothetical protein
MRWKHRVQGRLSESWLDDARCFLDLEHSSPRSAQQHTEKVYGKTLQHNRALLTCYTTRSYAHILYSCLLLRDTPLCADHLSWHQPHLLQLSSRPNPHWSFVLLKSFQSRQREEDLCQGRYRSRLRKEEAGERVYQLERKCGPSHRYRRTCS